MDGQGYVVEADWLVRILRQSNMDDYESLLYFQRALTDSGIVDALIEKGIQDGDTVYIDDYQFDYMV